MSRSTITGSKNIYLYIYLQYARIVCLKLQSDDRLSHTLIKNCESKLCARLVIGHYVVCVCVCVVVVCIRICMYVCIGMRFNKRRTWGMQCLAATCRRVVVLLNSSEAIICKFPVKLPFPVHSVLQRASKSRHVHSNRVPTEHL